jgi:hypothetical protein
VITSGVNPSLHVEYKRSHVKQYFKENRALRTETTINQASDFGATKALKNLPFLRNQASAVNRRLLEVERLGHNCTLSQEALDRLQRPTLEADQRAPGLRFGDARVMALLHALCVFDHVQRGFRNRDIRQHVADLLGQNAKEYAPGRMTYDLRRLRLKGLIARIPKTHRYSVTTYGLRVALFCSKLFLRILRPAWPALLPAASDQIPRPLRSAFLRLDSEIQKLSSNANLKTAG